MTVDTTNVTRSVLASTIVCSVMTSGSDAPAVLLEDVVLGESPRWHDGRLWFCDWGRQEVVGVDLDGRREVLAGTPDHPWTIVWLPDGRMLCTAAGHDAS